MGFWSLRYSGQSGGTVAHLYVRQWSWQSDEYVQPPVTSANTVLILVSCRQMKSSQSAPSSCVLYGRTVYGIGLRHGAPLISA